MKNWSSLRQMGAVSLLLTLMAGQSDVYGYPTGSMPIPPKPKFLELDRLSTAEGLDPVAFPSGTPVIPPKPKARAMDLMAIPSGSLPIPPKPKAIESEVWAWGNDDLISFPSGTIPVPPKPLKLIASRWMMVST